MLFSDEFAQIDTSKYSSARITKLYGTMSRKGANTKERPHGDSKIIFAPNNIAILDKASIVKVVELYPKEEVKTWQDNYHGNSSFDLHQFILNNDASIKKELSFSGGTKLIIDCSFDENRKGDGAIFKLNNGALGYKCFHNSCQHQSWEIFRNHFEANRSDYRQICYNRRTDNYNKSIKFTPQVEKDYKGKNSCFFLR